MNTHYPIDRTFEMSLLASLLEPNADQTVLLLEAGPGYGKSLLLGRYVTVIDSGRHLCAMVDLKHGANSAVTILCNLCHQWGWEHFPSYHAAMQRISESPAIDVNVRALQLGRPELHVVLPEDAAQRQVRIQELTKAWFDDVRCWLEHSPPAVILIDTYNVVDTSLGSATVDGEFCNWMEREFLLQLVRTPALRLILAGQQAPERGFTRWERHCYRHRLGPIRNPDDWMEFIQALGAQQVSRNIVSAYCHSEAGHPLSIATRLSMLCTWCEL